MNENPEGTPNPLNPVQGAAPEGQAPVNEADATEQPSSAEPAAEQPVPAEQPVVAEQPVPAEPAMEQPLPAEQPVQEVAEALEAVEAVADNGAPMKIEADKKPKKTGLIIAIIFLVVAIIGGVAAALVVLNPFAKATDAVPAAISKLLKGEVPKNVTINGTTFLSSGDPNSQFKSLAMVFNANINNQTNENYANAKITAELADGNGFGFEADEVHTAGGDLYLKLSNVYGELLEYYGDDVQSSDVTDCTGEGVDCVNLTETVEANCDSSSESCALTTTTTTTEMPTGESLLDYIGVFDVINDEWIRIPNSNFSSVTDLAEINMPTQCLVDAAGKLNTYGKDLASAYDKNQFIEYSTDDIWLVANGDPIYRLSFNNDKLAGFINSMNNSGFINELLACVGGTATNMKVNGDDLAMITSYLPTIFVEINDNNDFTRVYLSVSTPDGLTSAAADLSFSYPANISIDEPASYIDINQALSMVLTNFLQQPVTSDEQVITITE